MICAPGLRGRQRSSSFIAKWTAISACFRRTKSLTRSRRGYAPPTRMRRSSSIRTRKGSKSRDRIFRGGSARNQRRKSELVADRAMTKDAAIPVATEAARISAPAPASTADIIPVRALLVGERLDMRALERNASLGTASLTLDIRDGGIAVLFRYGAVVLFGSPSAATEEFVAALTSSITGAFPLPEQE